MFDVGRKLIVFISSKCDSTEDKKTGKHKYEIVRKAIKFVLDDTGLFDTYIFENEGASSTDVVSSYIIPEEDSDLIIIIVDNKDGVSKGIQNEIDYARAHGKKVLYFFCNDSEKEPTSLQKELRTSGEARYDDSCNFTELVEKVRNTILKDVVRVYKDFCKGRLVKYEGDNQTLSSASSLIEERLSIPKESFRGFSYTKNMLKSEAGFAYGTVGSNTDKDPNCADILARVLGNPKINLAFTSIKEQVTKNHKGSKAKRLIEMRYDAVQEYLSGDLEKCEKTLLGCLEYCKNEWKKGAPKWVQNDVTLDLRNIQSEINLETGNNSLVGLELLNAEQEPLDYPLMDRIVADFSERIIKRDNSHELFRNNTIDLGSIDSIIGRICDSFIVAYCYGSITHMFAFRRRIADFLITPSIDMRNDKTFIFCVKMLLLTNAKDLLAGLVRTYGISSRIINETTIDELNNCVESIPIKWQRVYAKLLLLQYFGDYFDSSFDKELEKTVKSVKKYVSREAFRYLGHTLINVFKANKKRIDGKLIFEFLSYLHHRGQISLRNELLKDLSRSGYGDIDEDIQASYQVFLESLLNESEEGSDRGIVLLSALALRKEENIAHDRLDAIVKEVNENFYKNEYRINTEQIDENELNSKVIEWIGYIKEACRQKESGVDIKGYDYLAAIRQIVLFNLVKLVDSTISVIIEGMQGVLLSGEQSAENKIKACEVLTALQLQLSDNERIQSVIILANEECVMSCDLYDAYSVERVNIDWLELQYQLLRECFTMADKTKMQMSFARLQHSGLLVKIGVLRSIEQLAKLGYLSICASNTKCILFDTVLNMSFDQDNRIKQKAIGLLVVLSEDSELNCSCFERIEQAIHSESSDIVVEILKQLVNANNSCNQMSDFISALRNDANYHVRYWANKLVQDDEK